VLNLKTKQIEKKGGNRLSPLQIILTPKNNTAVLKTVTTFQ